MYRYFIDSGQNIANRSNVATLDVKIFRDFLPPDILPHQSKHEFKIYLNVIRNLTF